VIAGEEDRLLSARQGLRIVRLLEQTQTVLDASLAKLELSGTAFGQQRAAR